MNFKNSILAACFLFAAPQLFAQSLLSEFKQKYPHKATFAELQKTITEWSNARDLSKEKGWKWLKRWEDYYAQRISPDGSFPPPAVYADAAGQVVALKEKSNTGSRGSGWMPVGPTDYAVELNPDDERGMGRINCIAFHPADTNTFWVGVAQGGVWKTTNHGDTWTPLTDDLPILRISDIAVDPNHPDTLYISVGDYAYMGVALHLDDRKRHSHFGLGVYKTTDGGQTWTPTGLSFQQTDFDFSLTRRVFIDAADSDHLLAAGTYGIRKSYDGGDTWTQILDSLISDIERDPSNPNVLYASSGYRVTLNLGASGIIKSTDFGETWTILPSGIPGTGQAQRTELAISSSNPNYVYAVSCNLNGGLFGIYRSTDAGATWNLQSNSPNILHWGDGTDGSTSGQGWYDLTIAVDPNNENRVFVGGINVWGSDDGGITWDGVSYYRNTYGQSIHADQHFFAWQPLNNKFFVCNDGGLYVTTDPQIGSWNDANNNPAYEWPANWQKISGKMQVNSFYRLGLSANNPDYIIAGTQDNSTFYHTPLSAQWRNMFGGDGMECMIHPDNPEKIYGSYQYGTLLGSDDGGFSTFWLTSGIDEDGEWTTPYLMHPNDPDVLYAGYGNVYQSLDEGWNWFPISSFPNVSGLGQPSPASALAVAPSNSDYIYVAKRIYHSVNEPMAFWRTKNNGTTWDNVTAGLPDSLYITYIAVDDADEKVVWATCSGFTDGVKVFKSTDAGDTWQNISANLPNLPVNCVITHHNTLNNAVYIATDIGVWYINDDSTSWTLYAENLPNVIVSELEIHAQTNKLYAATFGRGIWSSDLLDVPVVGENEVVVQHFEATVSPNPNDGNFNLRLTNPDNVQLHFEVIDVMGRVVFKNDKKMERESINQQLELSLPAGAYYLRVFGNGKSVVRKFVVE